MRLINGLRPTWYKQSINEFVANIHRKMDKIPYIFLQVRTL